MEIVREETPQPLKTKRTLVITLEARVLWEDTLTESGAAERSVQHLLQKFRGRMTFEPNCLLDIMPRPGFVEETLTTLCEAVAQEAVAHWPLEVVVEIIPHNDYTETRYSIQPKPGEEP